MWLSWRGGRFGEASIRKGDRLQCAVGFLAPDHGAPLMCAGPIHLALVPTGTDGEAAHEADAIASGCGRRWYRVCRHEERAFPQALSDHTPNL